MRGLKRPDFHLSGHLFLLYSMFWARPGRPVLKSILASSCNGLKVEGNAGNLCLAFSSLTDFFSLDDLIDSRKGIGSPLLQRVGDTSASAAGDSGQQTRSSRIRAFRAQRSATADERNTQKQRQAKMAVHMLSGEEIKSLFQDITAGLAFLVSIARYLSPLFLTLVPKAR